MNNKSRSLCSHRSSRFCAFALALLVLLSPLALLAATYTDGPHTYTYDVSGGRATITGYSGPGGAVSIPASFGSYPVTVIGSWALSGIDFTAVTLPGSVTHIGNWAFSSCTSLDAVTIPGSVTNIGRYAFLDCTSLTTFTSATSSDSVSHIGEGAFYGCTSLTSATLPDGVATIGIQAFAYCSSLPSIALPGSVVSIGGSAFANCTLLTSITLPDSVNSIGNSAFANCSSLFSATIPDGVTVINDFTFSHCTSLVSVVIGNCVSDIRFRAFYGCTSLAAVLFTGSVPAFGDYVFEDTPSTLNLYYFPDIAGWGGLVAGRQTYPIPLLYSSDGTQVTITGLSKKSYAGHLSLPPTFNGLPVTAIDDRAFETCSKLTSVVIPDSVTTIGTKAFHRCYRLISVTIPGSITAIGNYAFYNCPSLISVTVPGSVTNLSEGAFYYCASLKSVTILDGVTAIGPRAFESCPSLISVTIPDSVTTIGDSAFEDCTSLSSITIPGSVTDIGEEAFYRCSSLVSITIPGSVTNIGNAAFYYCELLESATIGNGVITIGHGAFYVCLSLASVTIPDSVETIGNAAFGGCISLSNAVIGNSVTNIDAHAFFSCTSLVSVTIPVSVETMGDNAFAHCTQLTGVYFCGNAPNTVGSDMFTNALNVTVYRMAGKTGWPNVPDPWQNRPTALWAGPPPPPAPPAPPVPADYLCAPAGDAELATVGSYDGYFYATEAFGKAGKASAVRGTFFLKVTSLAGKLTAKATLQGGNVSFKGAVWSGTEADGTQRAELTASGGEKLDLFVRQNRIWGTLTGGKAGATALELDGARNRFADRGDTEAAALLETFMGYYTVALPAVEGGAISAPGGVDAAPQGAGYLTITVRARGAVRIAGILADGTKVSRASRLILFDGCGPEACVPLFAPLYSKKGWAGGLLWIDPATRVMETDRDLGWFIRWENPGRVGPDGFSLLLDACGGFYGTGAALAAAYRFGAETNGTAYFDTSLGVPRAWAVQPEAALAAAGNRMTIAKGAKPKKVSEEGAVWYEYDAANPANANFSFAARTGIFKGRFRLYCGYEDAAGKLIHKAVSVPYAGVLAPLRGKAFKDLPDGLGYCLIPDNDPAVRAFRLRHSRLVWLEEK